MARPNGDAHGEAHLLAIKGVAPTRSSGLQFASWRRSIADWWPRIAKNRAANHQASQNRVPAWGLVHPGDKKIAPAVAISLANAHSRCNRMEECPHLQLMLPATVPNKKNPKTTTKTQPRTDVLNTNHSVCALPGWGRNWSARPAPE